MKRHMSLSIILHTKLIQEILLSFTYLLIYFSHQFSIQALMCIMWSLRTTGKTQIVVVIGSTMCWELNFPFIKIARKVPSIWQVLDKWGLVNRAYLLPRNCSGLPFHVWHPLSLQFLLAGLWPCGMGGCLLLGIYSAFAEAIQRRRTHTIKNTFNVGNPPQPRKVKTHEATRQLHYNLELWYYVGFLFPPKICHPSPRWIKIEESGTTQPQKILGSDNLYPVCMQVLQLTCKTSHKPFLSLS